MKSNCLTIEYNDCLGERHQHEYPVDIGAEPIKLVIRNIVAHSEYHRMNVKDLRFRVITNGKHMTMITLMFEPNMNLRTFQYYYN